MNSSFKSFVVEEIFGQTPLRSDRISELESENEKLKIIFEKLDGEKIECNNCKTVIYRCRGASSSKLFKCENDNVENYLFCEECAPKRLIRVYARRLYEVFYERWLCQKHFQEERYHFHKYKLKNVQFMTKAIQDCGYQD